MAVHNIRAGADVEQNFDVLREAVHGGEVERRLSHGIPVLDIAAPLHQHLYHLVVPVAEASVMERAKTIAIYRAEIHLLEGARHHGPVRHNGHVIVGVLACHFLQHQGWKTEGRPELLQVKVTTSSSAAYASPQKAREVTLVSAAQEVLTAGPKS